MRLIVVLMALLAASTVCAKTTLYRWVDDQGEVHFSDTAPPKSVEAQKITVEDKAINTLPGNQRQVQEMQTEQRARQVYHSRAVEDWERRYKAAEQALQVAKSRLEEAKKVGEGDTVGSFMGGARPTTEWLDQLEAAKKNLQEKQQAMDKLEQEKKQLLYAN